MRQVRLLRIEPSMVRLCAPFREGCREGFRRDAPGLCTHWLFFSCTAPGLVHSCWTLVQGWRPCLWLAGPGEWISVSKGLLATGFVRATVGALSQLTLAAYSLVGALGLSTLEQEGTWLPEVVSPIRTTQSQTVHRTHAAVRALSSGFDQPLHEFSV